MAALLSTVLLVSREQQYKHGVEDLDLE